MNELNINKAQTAGALAGLRVIKVLSRDLLSDVEKMLRNTSPENVDDMHYIYVLDDKGYLEGVFSVLDLFSNSMDTLVSEIMITKVISVEPAVDQEELASVALKNNIKAVPVVDKKGVFCGVVSADSIFQILSEEHSEDILRVSGIQAPFSASSLLKERVGVLLWSRLPWLILGLFGGLLAAFIVSSFEDVLNNYIILAFFLPLVVYMSDAVATQTQAIFIRAIALDQSFSIKKYVFKEFSIGFFIAGIVSVVLGLVSLLWFQDIIISLVLTLSLFFAVLVSVLVAVFMVIFLSALGKDPAVGSGPFATIVIDILTILIYFLVSTTFLTLAI